MLTKTDKSASRLAAAPIQRSKNPTNESVEGGRRSRQLAKLLRIGWLGQTTASLCWIGSVFAYGVSSPGDWLQLCAASAWFIANLADAQVAEAD